MSFKAFGKRLYEEYENDSVADSAAALSYYFVFALFPFLFFLATLTAFVPYIRHSVDTILQRAQVGLDQRHRLFGQEKNRSVGVRDDHWRRGDDLGRHLRPDRGRQRWVLAR